MGFLDVLGTIVGNFLAYSNEMGQESKQYDQEYERMTFSQLLNEKDYLTSGKLDYKKDRDKMQRILSVKRILREKYDYTDD